MIQPSEAFQKLNEYLITERDNAKPEVADALQKVRDYMTGLIQERVTGSYIPSEEEIAANNARIMEEARKARGLS